MTEIAVVFAVNVVGSLFKKWVAPRWGKFGVQVLVFVGALLGALYLTYESALPGVKEVVTEGVKVFALAVAFYEVILSKFPAFKREDSGV